MRLLQVIFVAVVVLLENHVVISQSRSRTSSFGNIELTAGGGLSYYMGDLRAALDLQFIKPQGTLGINYRFTQRLAARGEVVFYRLAGSQAGGRNWYNNLSFRADNPAVNVGLQIDAVKFADEKRLKPYFFAGAGLTYITPKAHYMGDWYSLAPLQTEKVSYARIVPYLLTGLGVGYQINSRWRVAMELSNNFTWSDYLDDVSTLYPDPAGMSELALRFSDRRPELDPALLPPNFPSANLPGYTRGNPKVKDSFGFLTFKVYHLLSTRHERLERRTLRCFVP